MSRPGAVFSPDRVYRYNLTRELFFSSTPASRVTFILLNPSTADETKDDPTIRRCLGFAKRWGYKGLNIVNLFALRSTDPRALYKHEDPVGPQNLNYILDACVNSTLVIAAWGNHGRLMNQGDMVLDSMSLHCDIKCLRVAKTLQPVHPLYLPGNLEPFLLRGRRSH